MPVTVRRIFISPGHNYFGRHGMEACAHEAVEVREIECVAGHGIRGDRFFDFKPDYKGQATFFDLAVFRELLAHRSLPADTCPSTVRRNIFTEGVDLNTLIGQEFTVQGVRFLGTGECSPCYWMDTALAPGAEAFLKGRGGLRCKILSDGVIRAGKSSLIGLVLAGGASSRMGEDKAFIVVNGETLVARQVRLLREAGCANVIISGRAGVDYSRSAGLRPAVVQPVRASHPNDAGQSPALPSVVHDAPGVSGPLAGILAAFDALEAAGSDATHLITLPVDLPAMRAETLRALIASCESGYGVVARSDSGIEPLVAVLPRELAPVLRAAVAAGELSPKALFTSPAIAGHLRETDPRPGGAGDDFTNWNRREDWSPPVRGPAPPG